MCIVYQLDDLDEDPVVSRTRHQLEEQRSKRQVVLGILTRQFTDDVHCRRLYAYAAQRSTSVYVIDQLLTAAVLARQAVKQEKVIALVAAMTKKHYILCYICRLHGTAVERRSLAGEFSMSCARPAANA